MTNPSSLATRHSPPTTRRSRRARRIDVLEDIIFELAKGAARDETRLAAAIKLHAIYQDTSHLSPSSNDVSSLSDAELADELARLGAAAG